MNLTLIKTFLAIVETGSLIKASQHLNVTQSTVTSRLKALEEDLGQILIQRQKSGVLMTASGHKFRRYAEAMNNLWNQALLETSLPTGTESVCNFGCDYDLWAGLGLDLSTVMRLQHPRTAFSWRAGDHAKLDNWLGAGLIDVALTYRPSSQNQAKNIKLRQELLVLYGDKPDINSKNDPGYIFFDAGEEFAREHAAFYNDAGVSKFSLDQASWVLELLLQIGGSAYLPRHIAQPHVDSGLLYELADAPQFNRDCYLVTDKQAMTKWPWLPDMANKILS